MPEPTIEKRQVVRKLTTEMLTEIETSLAEIEWRLLHWLLRYPLQRADDLVVGVARWGSRATVYRHVQGLEARELVESILPKAPGTGKRLYHLSNLGLHVLAQSLERPTRELAQSWRADEAGLLRLLPRLPTLLRLQDVVNGLVRHAADAMTTQGRRPRLVRWTWQRDLTHRFRYREQALRLFADGTVALCIRTQQEESTMLDQWYGLFFLSTELDDERLMRLRLERLLCWRECPERWPFYQYMPPVLIVATSLRQCDHWQRAVEATALKLRLEPLQGALSCLPQPDSAQVNPWLLNWHTLATEVSCHLQALLQPLPPAAFPSSLRLAEDEHEGKNGNTHAPLNTSTVAAPAQTPTRRSRLIVGNLASRAAHLVQSEPEQQDIIALLGLRLTPCHWRILGLVLAHPLLSDEELAALLNLHRNSVRCSLSALHRLGCLGPIPTEVGKRWHLCERGLRFISTVNRVPLRTLAVEADHVGDAESPCLAQRGEAWLLAHLQHTTGMYGFFARLAHAAKQEPGKVLCWWETGAICERRYRVGEQWYNLRPDALAEFRVGRQRFRFWLEWDRGTMNVRDLAVKFSSYAHYSASREWARERSTLPGLVCIAPEIAQERRIQRVAHATLSPTPGLVIWTTTEGLLNERGPLAPIWSPGIPLPGQGAHLRGSPRQSIFAPLPDMVVN
jgi:hypothetical protein